VGERRGRLRLFGPYLRARYGGRVERLCIDPGLGCPNRDGTLSRDGCAFCREESYSRAGAAPGLSVAGQLEREMSAARGRGAERFIAYLQPGTNTFGPPEVLRRIYDEAVAPGEVVALAVGTRPDFVGDEVADLLASYVRPGRDVWVELGLQSASDETLARVNRNHKFSDFAAAVPRLRSRGVLVGVHLILSLPGEAPEDWRRTAELVGALRPDGVKLHHLQVVRGTALEREHARGALGVLTAAEYVSGACDVLERLPPETVVMRFVGESRKDLLVAPVWAEPKGAILSAIESELARRGSRQGSHFEGRPATPGPAASGIAENDR
jgi:hypothetical protein